MENVVFYVALFIPLIFAAIIGLMLPFAKCSLKARFCVFFYFVIALGFAFAYIWVNAREVWYWYFGVEVVLWFLVVYLSYKARQRFECFTNIWEDVFGKPEDFE